MNESISKQRDDQAAFTIETLARDLHEAGREAVEKGLTQNPTGTFIEWDAAEERVHEGRRVQARYIYQRWQLSRIT